MPSPLSHRKGAAGHPRFLDARPGNFKPSSDRVVECPGSVDGERGGKGINIERKSKRQLLLCSQKRPGVYASVPPAKTKVKGSKVVVVIEVMLASRMDLESCVKSPSTMCSGSITDALRTHWSIGFGIFLWINTILLCLRHLESQWLESLGLLLALLQLSLLLCCLLLLLERPLAR